jgi:hypothetical protein
VDLGIPQVVARNEHVVSRLTDISYLQVAGNRFARELSDIPAGLIGEGHSTNPAALIDVLVPAYTSRPRENVQVGADLFTTEVPGLQLALARRPSRSSWNCVGSTVRRCSFTCRSPTR